MNSTDAATDADRCGSRSQRPSGSPSGERRRQSGVVNARGAVRPLERQLMRMRLLGAVDEDRRDVEVVLTALQQAVAEVHGLGGMVHLPGGGMSGRLYLVADSGLPESMTRARLIIPD